MTERTGDWASPFPHERLDVYRVALELVVEADVVGRSLPVGSAGRADQLRRASEAIPLLIAEGANRRTKRQKRQRFVEARGECAEVASALDVIRLLHPVEATRCAHLKSLTVRMSIMLTRLIRRCN